MSITSKCPWCPNIHDVMSKYPWCPNVHDVQMSMISKCPQCGHTCRMWSYLSHVVTLFTCSHMCHIWSRLSHMVTLVTKNQYFNCWPKSAFVVLLLWTRPTYRPAWPQVKLTSWDFWLAIKYLSDRRSFGAIRSWVPYAFINDFAVTGCNSRATIVKNKMGQRRRNNGASTGEREEEKKEGESEEVSDVQ